MEDYNMVLRECQAQKRDTKKLKAGVKYGKI